MLNRNFETLVIEISKIRFHIRIPRPRIRNNQYFHLIPWKISDLKGKLLPIFNHYVEAANTHLVRKNICIKTTNAYT